MKSYVIKQFISILILVVFAFIGDYYIRNVYVNIESVALKQLIIFTVVTILLLVCNQLIYNYGKKEEAFMQHKIWNKMFIIYFGWLMISFVLFILLFFTTPLEDLISTHAWIMFIVVYYFLFVINMLVLSIVHIIVDHSTKLEKKILITWGSSSLLMGIILFVLPSV